MTTISINTQAEIIEMTSALALLTKNAVWPQCTTIRDYDDGETVGIISHFSDRDEVSTLWAAVSFQDRTLHLAHSPKHNAEEPDTNNKISLRRANAIDAFAERFDLAITEHSWHDINRSDFFY